MAVDEITGKVLNDIRRDIEGWTQETRENTTAIHAIGSELDNLRSAIERLRPDLSIRIGAEMRDRFNHFERRMETMMDRKVDQFEARMRVLLTEQRP